jgi:hypothetical protein
LGFYRTKHASDLVGSTRSGNRSNIRFCDQELGFPASGLAVENYGTIKTGGLLVTDMSFSNDGLLENTSGGATSIAVNDPNFREDQDINGADGVIKIVNGTLDLGVFANLGFISAVNSTVHFSDNSFGGVSNNAGDLFLLGGSLHLGAPFGSDNAWVDSGVIATIGTAIYADNGTQNGTGTISAGGIMEMLGGSMTGSTLEDDGSIYLGGGSIALSSLTIGAGGELSGFGTVANPVANSGIIDAVGKLDLSSGVTGDGHLQISKLATLELGGPTAEGVTFESNFGQLYLDKAENFSGTIAGMAKADSIDLADLSFSSHPVITNVSGPGAAGSTTDVTITDGTLTTTLQLLNEYAGQYPVTSWAYHLTSDQTGSADAGTLFTLANPHGHDNFVFASGLGLNVDAGSIELHDAVASPITAFADFAAHPNLSTHDAVDAMHIAAAVAAHGHDFLV